MLIKICGMMDKQNILDLDILKPDLIGLIFYKGSPRFVNNNFIPDTNTSKVGVFVNETVEYILEKVKEFNLSKIQLHGSESLAFVKKISMYKIPIIKMFHLENYTSNSLLEAYSPFCEYFLFDTNSKNHGGTGKKFDWQLLDDYSLSTPFILSGGINTNDSMIIKSIQHTAFAGIDINSGFELSAGIKNVEKIKKFIDEIRN